jgi:hypothetical protein
MDKAIVITYLDSLDTTLVNALFSSFNLVFSALNRSICCKSSMVDIGCTVSELETFTNTYWTHSVGLDHRNSI